MTRLRGKSLSLCVKDILSGKADIRNVIEIVTGTCCHDKEQWEGVVEYYSRKYWRKYSREKIDNVLNSVEIVQPRVTGGKAPKLSNGHWELVIIEDNGQPEIKDRVTIQLEAKMN